MLLGPGGGDALDPLHVAARDEIHVADALPNRIEGAQQVVAERLHVHVGPKGQPSNGEHNGRLLSSVRVADPLAASLEERATDNDCRREAQSSEERQDEKEWDCTWRHEWRANLKKKKMRRH